MTGDPETNQSHWTPVRPEMWCEAEFTGLTFFQARFVASLRIFRPHPGMLASGVQRDCTGYNYAHRWTSPRARNLVPTKSSPGWVRVEWEWSTRRRILASAGLSPSNFCPIAWPTILRRWSAFAAKLGPRRL